jgi:hypothetical protein
MWKLYQLSFWKQMNFYNGNLRNILDLCKYEKYMKIELLITAGNFQFLVIWEKLFEKEWKLEIFFGLL